MCLYPKLIKNPKYQPNKKNNYSPPTAKDGRVLYVAVGCGNCIECRTQKARSWQVRLNVELEQHRHAYFITLTFSDENLLALSNETNQTNENILATIATRRFLERWRKKHKKSLTHWLITELGHVNTERIHLHGILFTEMEITNEYLQNFWKYGFSDIGNYCNGRSINYIIKYMTKIDNDHKGYIPIILASPGVGKSYINEFTKQLHKYRPHESIEYYKLPNGQKVNLPIYYRNKLYTEEEREKLWTDRIDTHTMYVRGIEIKNIDTAEGQRIYNKILEEQQKQNTALGYGNDSKEWARKEYNLTIAKLNRSDRIGKYIQQKK